MGSLGRDEAGPEFRSIHWRQPGEQAESREFQAERPGCWKTRRGRKNLLGGTGNGLLELELEEWLRRG